MDNIIFVEGLGFSGSGAVLDLLREVEDCFVLPTEFRIINDPDGLLSLESAMIDNWTVFQGDVAIKRFRKLCKNLSNKYTGPYSTLDHTKIFGKDFLQVVDKYLDNLILLDFIGLWYGNDTYLKRKMIGRRFIGRNKYTTRKMYVAKNLEREEFLKYTREFLSELASLCLDERKPGLFIIDGDYSVLNPKRVLSYFPEGKMILVIRDPRDIMATVRSGLGAFMPDDFNKNIEWQLSLFKRWQKTVKDLPKDQFMLINFDDLVNKYEIVRDDIFSFLGIDKATHTKKLSNYNPSVSVKNVGIWKTKLSTQEASIIEQKFIGYYDRF